MRSWSGICACLLTLAIVNGSPVRKTNELRMLKDLIRELSDLDKGTNQGPAKDSRSDQANGDGLNLLGAVADDDKLAPSGDEKPETPDAGDKSGSPSEEDKPEITPVADKPEPKVGADKPEKPESKKPDAADQSETPEAADKSSEKPTEAEKPEKAAAGENPEKTKEGNKSEETETPGGKGGDENDESDDELIDTLDKLTSNEDGDKGKPQPPNGEKGSKAKKPQSSKVKASEENESPDESDRTEENFSEELQEIVEDVGEKIVEKLMKKRKVVCGKSERTRRNAKVTKAEVKGKLDKVKSLLASILKNFEKYETTFNAIKTASSEGKTTEAWEKYSEALSALKKLNVKTVDKKILCTLYDVAIEAEETLIKGLSRKDFNDDFQCNTACELSKEKSDTTVLTAMARDYTCFVTAIRKYAQESANNIDVSKDIDSARSQIFQPIFILQRVLQEKGFMTCALKRLDGGEKDEGAKPSEPAEKPAEKPAANSSEKPAEKPAENPSAKADETPSGDKKNQNEQIKRLIDLLQKNQ